MSKKINGTKEWAKVNVNIENGCPNDCSYCYAKAMAVRFHRATPESWKTPQSRRPAVEKNYRRYKGNVMFPTAHDITPENIGDCLIVLKKLLAAGNEVLIVCKPVPECIRTLCEELREYRDQILFRFTITSTNDQTLRYWEPNAPLFADRIRALEIAREHEFKTSVSCEPMIDNRVEDVVEAVMPLVTDAIWIGKPNRLAGILANNGANDEMKARGKELMRLFTEERVTELHEKYKDNPKIKWKESMKDALGLDRPEVAGLDI